MSKPRSLGSMLAGQDGGIQHLIDQAHRLAELEQRVLAYLPSSLASHCRVANLRAGTLVLLTDSAARYSKLRFLLPRLTKQLRGETELTNLQRVDLRVVPSAESRASQPERSGLSEPTSRLLQSSADGIADPELRRALQRLASRKKP